jgi:peptide deformylase
MALLNILHHPDPRLRKKTQPVADFGPSFQRLIDDLFETMYEAPGVGLAANQVGVLLRVAVMDVSEDKQQPLVLANPQILDAQQREEVEEGCLSVPDVRDRIQRYQRVRVRAQNRGGETFEMEVDGLAAQCVQHEVDHLDGKLYIDYLSSLKRERIRKKLQKSAAATATR